VTSGGAALAQLRSSPSAEGAQRVYMIKEKSFKRQASSDTTCGCVDNFKKDLTCRIIPDTRIYNQYRRNMTNKEIEEKIQSNSLVRIADAIEEILRMVKADQERSRKYMEERKDD